MALKVVSALLDNLLHGGSELKWRTSYEPDLDNQRDPVFYQGDGCIATISYKGFEVDIYCDGIMKCYNTETEQTYRTTTDFLDAGIENDKQLIEANEKEILVWENNAWFDMYVYGEHIDNVQHDLAEAIASAVAYLEEQYQNAKELESCIEY